MKKIFLILVILVMFIIGFDNISAYCDNTYISRLKKYVSNINISYNYRSIENQAVLFDITLNNIPNGVYFVDTYTDTTYGYSNTKNGEITIYNYGDGVSSSYKFYSASSECYGVNLGTKYYKLPIYNVYYNNSLCDEVPNFNLCQKWVNKRISYNEFMSKTIEYISNLNKEDEQPPQVIVKKSFLDKLIDLYVNYYYYFFIGIILICVTIIIISRRKNRFDL